MRAVLQRVLQASVTLQETGELISQIGPGLLVLVGLQTGDTKQDLEFMARKVINTKLWTDDAGKSWTKSVKEKNYQILLG